jgi:hypothetical protein
MTFVIAKDSTRDYGITYSSMMAYIVRDIHPRLDWVFPIMVIMALEVRRDRLGGRGLKSKQ